MTIEKQQRQGERNILERTGIKENHVIRDLNFNHGWGGYVDSLMSSHLTEEDTVLYHKQGMFAHLFVPRPEGEEPHGGVVYRANYYPLDVKLAGEELLDEDALATLIEEMIDKHIDQFLLDLKEVRELHPDSDLFLNFCPSDSILYDNTTALPFYAFIVSRPDGFWLETESSFLIVPADVLSKAY